MSQGVTHDPSRVRAPPSLARGGADEAAMKVWNWEGFWSYFTNLYLLEGALWTIGLTISTLILGGLIGLGLAVMRLSKHKALSRTAQAYIWIFRGTPLLVQLIIIYTGLPQLGLVRFTVLESAVIGLALNEAAYLSEILRGGILSVAKGQTEAARAHGPQARSRSSGW